jgi:hypothetical protein
MIFFWAFFGFCCGITAGMGNPELIFLNCAALIFGVKILGPVIEWWVKRVSR